MKEILEEGLRDFHKPFPVEEQVGNDGASEGNAQPLVDSVACQVWIGDCQESSEDDDIEREIDFG